MGCDIHLYIEYKRKGFDNWNNFGEEFNPGRVYPLFAKLANVRNYPGYNINPISEPRDMPSDTAWRTKDGNTLFIDDNSPDDERHTSSERAKSWVENGSSVMVGDYWVTHPDWHSHSWLNIKEYEESLTCVVGLLESEEETWLVEYFAILSAMKELEKRECETRIVFWFDN